MPTSKPKRLSPSERAFCEYVLNGDPDYVAYSKAYPRAKSYGGCRASASKLKARPHVQAYIKSILDSESEARIMSAKETLANLTRVARREEDEYTVTKDGEVIRTRTSVQNASKAAELLGKYHGLFIDRAKVEGDLELKIEVDYGDDPSTV